MKKRSAKKRVLSMEGIDPMKLLGVEDRNIRLVEDHFQQDIVVRGDDIIIPEGASNTERISEVIETLIRIASAGRPVSEGDVMTVLKGSGGGAESISRLEDDVVYYSTARRRGIVPRSVRQKEYVDAVRNKDVVFAIGPAGTGKTYLAVAMAMAALKKGEIEKIFISRPVVEAGENLGFLPGDLREKIDPYIRPIFDALHDMVGRERTQRLIDSGVIEIAPLAYMRGRTLNNAFAVLDEAQNSTTGQMKMFLTRLGVNSKAIVTGDITQIDLVAPEDSGLVAAGSILEGVEGIGFIRFGPEDVVRHRLVKRIIAAFAGLGTRESGRCDDAGEGGKESGEDTR